MNLPPNSEDLDFELESGLDGDDLDGPRPSPPALSASQGFPFDDDVWNEDISAALQYFAGYEREDERIPRVPPLPRKAETWALRLNSALIRDTLKILANVFISARRTNAVNSIRDTLVLLAHELPTLLPQVLESDTVCQFYFTIITR